MSKTAAAWTTLGLLALAGALLAARPAAAHEGHRHQAMGTVASIDAARVVVSTTDGARRAFALSPATKFLRGRTEVRREEVETGERAVILYETRSGVDDALEVRLAAKPS